MMKLLYFLPLLFLIFTPVFAYNSGFRPVYQPTSVSGSNPAELYCIFGEFLNTYNSTTNSFTCAAGTPGGSGENNTASNVGLGIGVFKQKTGVNLKFKSLLDDGIINISSLTNEISFALGLIPKTQISTSGQFGWNEVSKIASSIHDLANVTENGCSINQYLSVNSSGFFVCTSLSASSLKVDTLPTIPTDYFISAFDNSTGDWITKQFSVNTKACSGTDKVSSIDNVTGNVVCTTDTGGTDTNTAQIASAGGTSLFKSRDNATQNTIKGLTTTSGITLTANTNDINISTNFKVNTKTSATRQFLTSFDNATTSGLFGTVTFGANTKTCSGTDKFSSYSNTTGLYTCSTDQTGGTAREDNVANWGTDRTWTNIGLTYNDVYTTANSNGEGIRIDTAGKTTVTSNFMWTKVGAGTQKCQIVDIASASNILIVGTNLASGQNTNATQNIPAGLANTIKTYKPQCLSSTAADDPVWLSGQVLLK